jgi:hypothetical protein
MAEGTVESRQVGEKIIAREIVTITVTITREITVSGGIVFQCFQWDGRPRDRPGQPFLDLGSSSRKGVEVQVLSSAPTYGDWASNDYCQFYCDSERYLTLFSFAACSVFLRSK